MAKELKPGDFVKLCSEIAAESRLRSVRALTEIGLNIEKQAKLNASNGSHKLGTRTPAMAGEGPAVISGNLRRAITHTPVRTVGADTLEMLVGTARGFPAPYGQRVPANVYGFYLEVTGVGPARVTFPFLQPAFKFTMGVPAKLIYAKNFGYGWKTLI
jgi:hypothetical protein